MFSKALLDSLSGDTTYLYVGTSLPASHICEFSLLLNSSLFIFALYLPYTIFSNPHLFI